MSLSIEIDNALKDAMKNKDKETLSTLRMLKASLTNKRIELGQELSDEQVLAVIKSEVKKRKDSVEAYEQAERPELAQIEKTEIEILEKYLPEQMTAEIVKEKAEAVLHNLPEEDKQNFGKVMQAVMAELKGQADGSVVSQVVKELIG